MTLDEFITRWSGQEGGAERANYALFLSEFCEVMGLPRPDPAGVSTEGNDYVFERFVRRPDGSNGRIDLYKRDCFVLEAKQSRQATTTLTGAANDKFLAAAPEQTALDLGDAGQARGRRSARRGWDVLMLNARAQAEDYARHLPQDHGWPPFVIVCDVGHSFELFADFRRMGKYEQFPDRQSYRIYLSDLRDETVRDRLRQVWTDPYALDPAKAAAKTTRDIARRLAEVTKALEKQGANGEDVAHFLMRCIFTMFAEDWRLLPENSFTKLLERSVEDPTHFPRRLKSLWSVMETGGWSDTIDADVRHFNGGLFANTTAFELGREEIGELLAAAKADWREVEPAIFGTLLEQALDPKERRKLGAHYTPRAYVERLVTATIIEPLREDWARVQAAAEVLAAAGDEAGAAREVKAFHDTLCKTRVLDPACGTGNFLYVSLELMKRLEGEVLEALADLGGQEALTGLERHTVDPHQFLGLELNPRAAAIAELVLWIGYLQQHFRLKGAPPGDPILRAFKNINFGRPGGYDAVLTWGGWPVPKVVDGKETYPNARRPEWPEAEFIVGNPPFVRGSELRDELGECTAHALWKLNPHMSGQADLVTYWWDRAADTLKVKGSKLRRFGFVTTNSITQLFSRRVLKRHLDDLTNSCSLVWAIDDHPWYRASPDNAQVRIAMTVVERGRKDGLLLTTSFERDLSSDTPSIGFVTHFGWINSDLTIGADVTKTTKLKANCYLAHDGVKLHGGGFIIPESAKSYLDDDTGAIKAYTGGRDLSGKQKRRLVIDLYGRSEEEVRTKSPRIYQHLVEQVRYAFASDGKPRVDKKGRKIGREWNARPVYQKYWWIFGEPRAELRPALSELDRYIVTVDTSPNRLFQFVPSDLIVDDGAVIVAHADAWVLATLNSSTHVTWALRAGGWLGVGNDPRWNKSLTFDPFPFPSANEALKLQLRAAGEELDTFRKARQAEHPRLTLTQMYNVREAIRAGRALTPDEERIKAEGLVLILNELHDRIDALTLQAYGWPEGLSDEELLERLVALNAERAAEERRGIVRWLRPDYQKARAGVVELKRENAEMELAQPVAAAGKPSFPTRLMDQMGAVTAALLAAPGPLDAAGVAAGFKNGGTKPVRAKVADILTALARTGAASSRDGGKTFQARRAA